MTLQPFKTMPHKPFYSRAPNVKIKMKTTIKQKRQQTLIINASLRRFASGNAYVVIPLKYPKTQSQNVLKFKMKRQPKIGIIPFSIEATTLIKVLFDLCRFGVAAWLPLLPHKRVVGGRTQRVTF